MFRIDDPSASPTLPAPEGAGTPGYWTEGNPGGGVPATLVRASFLNMLQEELVSILTAAGIAPSKTTYNQLLQALSSAGVFQTPALGDNSTKAATTAFVWNSHANSLGASGWQKFPRGLILQNLIVTVPASSVGTFTLPFSFPTAFDGVLVSCYGTTVAASSNAFLGALPNGLSQVNVQNLYTASSLSAQLWCIGR